VGWPLRAPKGNTHTNTHKEVDEEGERAQDRLTANARGVAVVLNDVLLCNAVAFCFILVREYGIQMINGCR
jgi:hypothetical protein